VYTYNLLVTKVRLERELWSTQLPVQRAASLVGRVSCRVFSCGNRRARDRNNFNTLMIKLLRFLLLLVTASYHAFFTQLVREAVVWIAWAQETRAIQHAVPKWPAFPQKSQSTDDFSLPFKTKATAREMSLLSCSSSGEGPEARKSS
jgi:hypothetical protein